MSPVSDKYYYHLKIHLTRAARAGSKVHMLQDVTDAMRRVSILGMLQSAVLETIFELPVTGGCHSYLCGPRKAHAYNLEFLGP